MALKFYQAPEGEYIIEDSMTGETRVYSDQKAWICDALVELLRATERIEQGLADLERSYARGSLPKIEEPGDDEVPDIEVWP
ncbi:hypothetical protein [Polyangium spumosum]|uniref:Uncharacterized protein n=1 Tax=Polyangium spumosum TaxID=889282 RepID=A0A6N7Q579_9BACT|nr:hypothetical protein [Polyangium spumosum]MRG96001.1 hypothetical protein [Polyangium spumosum]